MVIQEPFFITNLVEFILKLKDTLLIFVVFLVNEVSATHTKYDQVVSPRYFFIKDDFRYQNLLAYADLLTRRQHALLDRVKDERDLFVHMSENYKNTQNLVRNALQQLCRYRTKIGTRGEVISKRRCSRRKSDILHWRKELKSCQNLAVYAARVRHHQELAWLESLQDAKKGQKKLKRLQKKIAQAKSSK